MAAKHRLLDADAGARTGTCERCGPVRLHSSGRGGWVCAEKNRATAAKWRAENPERARAGTLRWRLENAERDKRVRRAYRANNPEVIAGIDFRRGLRAYGLTADAYSEMLAAQGGRCATCDRPEPGGQGRWHIDHDHRCCPAGGSCGKCVRGLLCSSCNRALGLVRDDASILLRMADYLSKN